MSAALSASAALACEGSLMILDLNGRGVQTTGTSYPVSFDLDGDGATERMAWTSADAGNALLWLDLNGNGTVDNGRELFGDGTRLANGERVGNGFRALAQWDATSAGGDADGAISSGDRAWGLLRLWIDRNHDGVSQENEISRLEDFGVLKLRLDYTPSSEQDGNGNYHHYKGFYVRSWRMIDGRDVPVTLSMEDVYLHIAE